MICHYKTMKSVNHVNHDLRGDKGLVKRAQAIEANVQAHRPASRFRQAGRYSFVL